MMEEKLDVLNERGEFTGEIATREECHKNGNDEMVLTYICQ